MTRARSRLAWPMSTMLAVLTAIKGVESSSQGGFCCFYSPFANVCDDCQSRNPDGDQCNLLDIICVGQCGGTWCAGGGGNGNSSDDTGSDSTLTLTSTTSSFTALPNVSLAEARCSVPTIYSQEKLTQLIEFNCNKVGNASLEYQKAIEEGRSLDLEHADLWEDRVTLAQKWCSLAEAFVQQGAGSEASVTEAAHLAVNAWGTIMMDGAECCTIPGPPFCVATEWSASTLAVGVPIGLLLVLFAASSIASWCNPKRNKDLDISPKAGSKHSLESEPLSVMDERFVRGESAPCADLEDELKDMFTSKSCLRVLPTAIDLADSSAHLFAKLCSTFGFQVDSVRNQFEHLLSLWRSECAMVADAAVGAGDPVQESTLLQEALRSLHGDMLDGFCRWRSRLADHAPASIQARGPASSMPPLGGVGTSWSNERLWVFDDSSVELSSMLSDIATFLLVWGEAGNVRFMPELIYFITELALAAGEHPAASKDVPSGAFLAGVIRPIYNAIFEEWHDSVDVDPATQKDKKRLKAGFENFLPADVANYDDWNELFCDPERLVAGVVLNDGTRLFALGHSDRFAALSRVDWRASLAAKETKTHREVHSLWGVFASTHRIWLVHFVLFFCAVCAVSGTPVPRSEGERLLGGVATLDRFAAAGLVVPLHALVWVVARWQVTGSAVRRQRGGWCRCLRVVRNVLLWALPLLTYAMVRDTEEGSEWEEKLPHSAVLAAHYTVSVVGLVMLLRPKGTKYNPWALSSVPVSKRAARYLFWACVLALKFLLGMVIINAVDEAMRDLSIATPGRQSPSEIAELYFSTAWISDVLIWLVLWSTTLLLFCSDTQLWFTMVCTAFGVAISLAQRGCHLFTYAFEDAVAKIPARFSKQVLFYASSDGPEQESFSPYFPLFWDRIVEFLRYEDKIDSHLMGDLSFNTDGAADRAVGWGQLQGPLLVRRERGAPESAQSAAGAAAATPATRRRVKVPDVFRAKTPFQRGVHHFMEDAHWPSNADVQWRLTALARGLGLPMPRPFRAPYFPGITVLIPHYSEPILLLKKDLIPEESGGAVPLINWVRHKYKEEFAAFSSRMQDKDKASGGPSGWPTALAEWDDYTDAQWDTVGKWASMRLQTLWRTVSGMCLYHQALQCHYEAQKDEASLLARPGVWSPSDCFTCLVSMQLYRFFDAVQLAHTDQMLEKFPDCLQVAFIDHELAGSSARRYEVHPRQSRRYFSCLMNRACPVDPDGRRKPLYRIELPGYPILGDGKGDNQNHAIPFMRGVFAQCIDANQGAYFEQMLLLPNALGEFRSRRGSGLAKAIVGFPEHITSDIGSIGDFAASAELAFGTILQRTYAVLGGRMHYGHPDIMNKFAMMQQGGVSKASKTLNLSEDIFAGMDMTLRGEGRDIRHCEYFHLAKGRDLGFNTVLGFHSKLSSGTGEQVLSRQTFRLGQVLHLPEAMTFHYAHGGFFFTQYLISAGMPVIAFVWLLVLVSDCEATFSEFQHCNTDQGQPAAAVMAEVLGTWFSWLLLLFLIANSLPLCAEMWMERGFKMALERLLKQLLTLSPLMFIFQSKVIGHYVVNEIRYGGATYVATGRGLPTERRPLVGEVTEKGFHLTKVGGLYLDYAAIACYDGAKLLIATLLVAGAGWSQWSEPTSSPWVWVSLSLTISSWLFAPFIFNPYQFEVWHYCNDLRGLMAFFLEERGRHWVDWFDSTQLRLKSKAKQSLVDITLFASVTGLMIFFQVLNAKAEALGHVYPNLSYSTARYVLMLVPPVGVSAVYCLLVALLGCLSCCPVLPQASEAHARQNMRRKTRQASRQVSRGASVAGDEEDCADEVEEAQPHRRMEDRAIQPARTTSVSLPGDNMDSKACQCGIPLPISAVLIVMFGIFESTLGLWTLVEVGWHQALVAGVILKWGWISLLSTMAESLLRRNSGLVICLRPLELWLYAHRMARDILTSFLIVSVLFPFVLLNSMNDLLCQGCSAHQLLIYRDPGHLARKEAFVRDVADMENSRSAPPTLLTPRQVVDRGNKGDELHRPSVPDDAREVIV